MTNLQYLQSLSAKELADYLYYEVYVTGYEDGSNDEAGIIPFCNFEQTEKWMNEEHL